MARRTTILTVFLVGSALSVTPASAADEGRGLIRSFRFVTADTHVSVETIPVGSWRIMPDMSIVAKTWGPVIVRFCGQMNSLSGSAVVTLAVDEENVPFGMEPDGGIQFAASSTHLPHCFTWVVSDLEPGWHLFEMLWRHSGDPGTVAYMQGRTLTVEGLVW